MSTPADSPVLPMSLNHAVWIDPERLGGAPAFRGTRVPIQNLFDYLSGGHTIDVFLDHFPGVGREQVMAVIQLAAQNVIGGLRSA